MKIFYYNWVDYLDNENRGGGVSVYQKNLLEELSKNTDHELYFLCSGISYDLFNTKLRIEPIQHGKELKKDDSLNKVKRFEIINSRVLSPGHSSFGETEQIEDKEMDDLFFKFVEEYGPFDVMHFNNIEGIPASFLKIKQKYPNTKVILSMHNYYPICSQVNLWYDEKEACEDNYYGKKCISCIHHKAKKEVVIRSNATAYTLKKFGIVPNTKYFYKPFITLAGTKKRIDKKIPDSRYKSNDLFFRVSGIPFMERREKIINIINENCDYVLAVSERVREICLGYGIKNSIVRTDYIGTKFSESYNQIPTPKGKMTRNGKLNLSYLGYMRRDKGFYFFVDALFDMPKELAEHINLIVVAKNSDQGQLNRIYDQIWKFNDIYYANGYNHSTLPKILERIDVGLVPSLWEDNLPQVAIEYLSNKIPIITSNKGGAPELSGNKNFTYDSLNKKELYSILEKIISGELNHDNYWKTARAPVSMKEHSDRLFSQYYK
ncbi:glycosyltransferase [Faucicola mancuniensis]|uniref:glycosyltransferase n=1 Tax=Faucicola mancuniensis TaxID=1309795 RepID=UPI003977BF95